MATNIPTARTAIILAAGKGMRMKSAMPKVMHAVAGKAMIDWSIDLALSVECDRTLVVCSPGQPDLKAHVEARLGPGTVALQERQLGTGDAVRAARQAFGSLSGTVVVLYGDTPLIRPESVRSLFEAVEADATLGVLGFEAAEPGGYGRLIMAGDASLSRIIEAKDATAEERAVTLCNSGVMAGRADKLFALLERVTNDNAKGEFYLTDIVGLAKSDGGTNQVVVCEEADVLGVNSRIQLAEANAAFQARKRSNIMASGVTLLAPETVFFSHDTEIGPDTIVEPNVVFGPGVKIDENVQIKAFSQLEGAHVSSGAVVGPYARLRPGSEIGPDVRIGNFVETKNVRLGQGAKINHLSYAGDGSVGAGANIGAGTIFCNYDGFEKHETHVGAGAFVGSNSALVAPVRVGDGAYIGSGSVITKDVSADALSVARARQIERAGWAVTYRSSMQAKKENTSGE
ncbi:MAG: bifunctional UDP-N-acetylglucosamine diphosphorylase/glucosamine-1-phosphate N-acetyltransferase GlmU [Pseudomonadota bacterium]